MMTHPNLICRALMFGLLAMLLTGPCLVRAADVTEPTQEALETALESGDSEIYFEFDGVIVLTNTVVISNSVSFFAENRSITISSPGGTNETNFVRLFTLDSEVDITVEFSNVTFADGRGAKGGAVFIGSNVTFIANSCAFSNNIALGTNGLTGSSARTNTVSGNASNGQGGTAGQNVAGGAIYNLGIAYFDRCAFLTNGAFGGIGGNGGDGGNGTLTAGSGGVGGRGGIAYGGAIYNARQIGVTNCTFNFNYAVGGNGGDGGAPGSGSVPGYEGRGGTGGGSAGAAIFNDRTSEGDLVDSTFALNGASSGFSADGGSAKGTGKRGGDGPPSAGGAVANYGTNRMVNCTFFANAVTGGNGGAGGNGTVTAGKGGNGGGAWGGNVFNGGKGKKSRAELTAINCTFSDGGATAGTNGVGGTLPFAAKDGTPGVSRGGNIANSNGVVYITNCIIAYPNPGVNAYGAFKAGRSLISDRSLKFVKSAGLITNTDPKLDILRANGGYVETMELLEGSKAIDAGTTNGAPEYDARGVMRTNGVIEIDGVSRTNTVDLGAYESGVYLGPPRITTQPISQIVREDGSVTFTVVAQGDAPLLYQWRRAGDSESDIDGATESSFTIDFVTDDDGGAYEVVVANNSGSVVSSNATLTVVHPPSIVEGLEDLEVDLGANFFLSVTAAGDAPLRYQWYTNDVRVPGATLSTFTVINAQQDGVNYRVQVCNTYGCVDSEASVTLVKTPPYIVVQPVDRVVVTNGNTSFSVAAGGSRPLSFQWFFNDVAIPSTNNASATNATLLIANAGTNNAGLYHVRVLNSEGSVDSVKVTLYVQTLPPVIASQPSSVTKQAGDTAEFTVLASGSAPLTYQWYFNSSTALSGGTNATLSLTNVQVVNQGSYHVVVANLRGTATSAPVTLTVNSSAPFITANPVATNVYRGDTATFTVSTIGSAPLSYQWFFNGTNLIQNAIAATLNIVNVNPTNAGSYHVVITNILGLATSSNAPAVLGVLGDSGPAITIQPVTTNSTVGSSATFFVSAAGNKPMFYRWLFNNVPIGSFSSVSVNPVSPTGTQLYITNTVAGTWLTLGASKLADQGEYRVEITNSFGSATSLVANLILGSAVPVIQTEPVSQGIYSGDTATFTVAAAGSPILRYQWYLNNFPISGATAATLVITNAQSANAGVYRVVVTNNIGTDISQPATLTISNQPPVITVPPQDVTTNSGSTVTFSVTAVGSKPFLYQWYQNGNAVVNATNAALIINNVNAPNVGVYQVTITNNFGGTVSQEVGLNLNN